MSDGSELLEIADKVIAQANGGEQLEAFVSRDSETAVRVYEGNVEHFVSAQSEGIGIRVIREGRTGFAYAGVLDEAAVARRLSEIGRVAWQVRSLGWWTGWPRRWRRRR